MLVGRDPELSALRALLAEVRTAGGAVALVGEPGVGKTALLTEARRRADGFVVAAARGVEGESELPFAGLADVVRPLLGRLADLPAPQRDALAGALALAPPSAGDRFAVCAAAHGLVGLTDDPLLVLVDDLHWLDAPSRECVEYLARRPPPGVAVLLAVRDEPPAGVPALTLAPLDEAGAAALLAERAPGLDGDVAAQLATAAAGNPLALVELVDGLSADERAGRVPLPRPPLPGGGVRRAFAGRIQALSPAARTALLAVAAAGSSDLVPVVRALAALGVSGEAVEEIEAAELATIAEHQIELGHPLVAAVAYHEATPAARRRVHAALADALGPERGAWQLAAAAAGPSATAADALERLAAEAAARRAHATAAAALERAARLSPDDDARLRRLLEGGRAALVAGRGARARTLLAEAASTAPSPELRLQAEHLLAHAELWGGDVRLANQIFERTSAVLAGVDPVVGAGALADATLAAIVMGDCRRGLAHAERASALLADGGDPVTRAHVLGTLVWSRILRGQGQQAEAPLAELERLAAAVDPRSPVAQSLLMATNARFPTEEHARARADALRMVAALRHTGSMTPQVMPLVVAADCAMRLGLWAEARRELAEAIELATATGQRGPLAQALTLRARLDAACARSDEARAAITQALAIAEPAGIEAIVTYAYAARGVLELGSARVEAALAALSEVEQLTERHGLEEPTQVPWAPDLVEALVRAGRHDHALEVQRRLAVQARAVGTPGAAALAARCAGLVAADAGDEHFAAALRHHARSPVVFERGRTLLAHGGKLHRVRRQADARRQLHRALKLFEDLGAEAWAELARSELRAAGGRLRASRDGLSPAELRVARAVARGATNREVATELYLSERTVEFHLMRVYRKLGVRSRTQLAISLQPVQDGPAATEAASRTGHPVA